MYSGRRLGRWLLAAALVAAVVIVSQALSGNPTASQFPVSGQFLLWDSFPASSGDLCDAKRSLYYDINSSTLIRAENQGGVRLATATLGDGRILSDTELHEQLGIDSTALARFRRTDGTSDLQACLFTFRLQLETGSDNGEGYVVRFGTRGRWQMSESQLRAPGALQWSIGLP